MRSGDSGDAATESGSFRPPLHKVDLNNADTLDGQSGNRFKVARLAKRIPSSDIHQSQASSPSANDKVIGMPVAFPIHNAVTDRSRP